jgi:rhamnose transport system ATP-binding protein
MTAALEIVGISKSFGGVRAVEAVSFDVRPGEVHALLGENGAGKSTLIKIMSGVQHADAGELRVDGLAQRFASPREARSAGIATVYQELLLFPELTVAENIFLGHAPRRALRAIDWAAMRQRARELLDSLECFELDVDAKVGTLSVANRQRVEIARALSQSPRVLIMDEPTAALAEADVHRLLDVVRSLRARGVGIVYVSHRMPEIFALADRVTVLRDGRHVATLPIAEVDHEKLVSLMVGRPVDQMYPKSEADVGPALLAVQGLAYRSRVQDISFTLHAGEILGIAGLVGSGRTELAHILFGITPATAGQIMLAGRPVAITSPAQARDLGIAYIPEDRGLQGLIRPQTIRENVSLAMLAKLSRGSFMRHAAELRLAGESMARFGIRARGPQQIVRQLSGGNQQKVVLAKWLATRPRVLIMDEPTRGIDVGAKAEIHTLISQLAQQGMAILMISSELPEVLGMSDRILVMNGGRLVARFGRGQASADQIGAAMMRAPSPPLPAAA